MTEHVDWDDESLPIGKRKVAFVKWLMQKRNVPIIRAKAMANAKFGKHSSSTDWREYEKEGIRRYGHQGQYDTPALQPNQKHDIAGLLARLAKRPEA